MSDVVMAEPDWESRYRQEEQIVARIWTMLGNPSYEALVGRSIYDLIAELQAKAAAHDDLLAALKAAHPIIADRVAGGRMVTQMNAAEMALRMIDAAITRATRAGGE